MLLSSNYTQQAMDKGLLPPSQPHASSISYHLAQPAPAFPAHSPSLLLRPFQPEPYLQRKAQHEIRTTSKQDLAVRPSGDSINHKSALGSHQHFPQSLANPPNPACVPHVRQRSSAVGPSPMTVENNTNPVCPARGSQQRPNHSNQPAGKSKSVGEKCTLLLSPFNALSKQHVLSLGHAINVSIPSK